MTCFDVIVIGAGHAGIEAAYAAAQMNGKVALLNYSTETIGIMSCNPAIGGLAKGHLAREVDALGGVMGKAIDQTGIQFRMLNETKGPAVWGPRAQADKDAYHFYMKETMLSHPGITVIPDAAAILVIKEGKFNGVETESGLKLTAGAVVITTGTFLRGVTHRGMERKPEGRFGEKPSIKLADYLRTLDLEIGRLKTGTPCRLHKDSLDYEKMEAQHGDANPMPFSFDTSEIRQKQTCCYMTYTTEKTRKIVLDNLHLSALYGGAITGIGPRYCPSIEDKYVKFKDKERHLLFVEPEGLTNPSMYVNGMPSSLPGDVQIQMIRSVPGLERADVLRVGYAIEYDFVQPTELFPNLELKKYPYVFLAGQINGTSGYEEAAAQGMMAGINAMLAIGKRSPFILKRSEAYAGVLIDDLVTKGVDEPYRMFTSRAEYRLVLRQDTADRRLTKYGYDLGIVKSGKYERMLSKYERIEKVKKLMDLTKINGKTLSGHYMVPKTEVAAIKAMQPEIFESLTPFEEITLFADIKYRGYIEREEERIKRTALVDDKKIPLNFDFNSIKVLRIEAREKLTKIRPQTIGQAKNICGISPADIQLILLNLEKRKKREALL